MLEFNSVRRSTLAKIAVTAFLVQGCAIFDSENGQVNKEAASDSAYVINSSEGIVMTADEQCLRTVSWNSANNHSKCGEVSASFTEPQPQPVERPVQQGSALVTFSGRALFDFDSATLTGAGSEQLDQLTSKLNSQDEIKAIEIVGHADSVGSDAYNQKLSENRADAVKVHLQRSLKTVTVRSKGMGESAPIADNNTEAGRRMNRRVDVNIAAMVTK